MSHWVRRGVRAPKGSAVGLYFMVFLDVFDDSIITETHSPELTPLDLGVGLSGAPTADTDPGPVLVPTIE